MIIQFVIIIIGEMQDTPITFNKKKDVSPKVTNTKITISKSTPFLIKKHHLDDTEMKSVLHYQQNIYRNKLPRTYSYKAEVFTTFNSQFKQSNNTNIKNYSKPFQTDRPNQYYQAKPVSISKEVQTEQTLKIKTNPKASNNRHQQTTQSSKTNNKSKNEVQTVNDYGLKKIERARRKIEKQADKLRKLYKKRVETEIKENQNVKTHRLQIEIEELRIKNIQLQKQKWMEELQNKEKSNLQDKQMKLIQKLRYNRAYLILNKPKFTNKTKRQDTDSSFSSFEIM